MEKVYTENILSKKESTKSINPLLLKIGGWSLLVLMALILVFPYFYMVMKSLMTSEEAASFSIVIFPKVPQFSNYNEIFLESSYIKATLNSLLIIAFNIFAITMSASLTAFAFSKLEWFGKGVVWTVMMSTLLLPGTITQIALYVLFTKLNWLNTFYPMTIPNLFGGGAFTVFLLRQFMMSIPKELEEAAKVDGVPVFRIYLNIIMPLCKPILLFVCVTIFMGGWGDYYGPMVYMPSADAPKTLPYLLYLKTLGNDAMGVDTSNIRMAVGVFMTIIPLTLFALFQKQLIEGVAYAGIKG